MTPQCSTPDYRWLRWPQYTSGRVWCEVCSCSSRLGCHAVD